MAALEMRTLAIGRELLAAARAAGSSKLFSEKLMNYGMADAKVKTALFRFVDVFPMLHSAGEVHRVLHEYLDGVKLPKMMAMGLMAGGLLKGAEAKVIGGQIEAMGRRFIAGRNLEEAGAVLRKQWEEGLAFSVDLLGEACISDAEAAAYQARYLDLIEQIAKVVGGFEGNAILERDHLGAIPRANVSVKISSLYARTKPVAAEASIAGLMAALEPILLKACELGVFVNFDMEQHSLKDVTLELFMRACETFDFAGGIALQAYLKSAEADARKLIAWTKKTGRVVTVRLIKGAYWDFETIHAEMMGWESPVWGEKWETDACFERVAEMLVAASPRESGRGGVKLAVGSHNVRSIARAMAAAESAGLPPNAIEVQMLRGMADELKSALVERGVRVREYVPVGEMIPGMAYLVRRLLENTSNESWLRAGFLEGASDEVLLAAPAKESRAAPPPVLGFINEPPRDFSDAEQREAFAKEVSRAKVPGIEIVRDVSAALKAVEIADSAREKWRKFGVEGRSQILRRAADLMSERRDALAALMVAEAKKTWSDADGDVCEAIDYLRFYADEAVKQLSPRRLTELAGESNVQVWEPRGVAVVIAPWNFPLAIPCGMTSAALVAGNPVILKPAEQTPAIARELVAILHDAGVPRDVLQFLPGEGETVGAALVGNIRTAVIAFTGSLAVGRQILAAAYGQRGGNIIPHVVCEMGGKNAIIVDETADLDEAVLGIRQSAFGYAGQKCSACSRLIAMDGVHDALVARLVEATRSMNIGDPRDPAADMGGVIDVAAAEKIRRYIGIGLREARLVYPDAASNSGGDIIVPHIFVDVKPDAQIAGEEIFGPVLAVIRVKDFDAALRVANLTGYKLTGGLYSRSPANLKRAAEEFRVGNLYLNRPITGAVVGRQPFGGSGLSGLGAKAGGGEYLHEFAVSRVVSENQIRRGFAGGEN
jgi:RHH-type proline utilization regulon transcriptional repressor/proline dehydrogenase/delta 1-pyrroline-5-carboxylate dehydrogenase